MTNLEFVEYRMVAGHIFAVLDNVNSKLNRVTTIPYILPFA